MNTFQYTINKILFVSRFKYGIEINHSNYSNMIYVHNLKLCQINVISLVNKYYVIDVT